MPVQAWPVQARFSDAAQPLYHRLLLDLIIVIVLLLPLLPSLLLRLLLLLLLLLHTPCPSEAGTLVLKHGTTSLPWSPNHLTLR